MGPGADVADGTAGAVRALGLAVGPTVEDEKVGHEGPLLPGNDPAELLLDLVLLVAVRKASRFIPIERLALSPQCGFASSVIRNVISVVDQPANRGTIPETAVTVWA